MARFKNLQELFLAASVRWSGRVAFRHVMDGKVRSVQYKDLSKLTYQCAQALWSRGVRSGDYIGICANNSPEWVIACFAAFRLGAIVVPLDARSRASEILPIIDRVVPKLILFGEKQYVQHSDRLPQARMELLSRLYEPAQLPSLPQLPSPSREDPALVVFTSGTSGASKGVVLTHGNILSNVVTAASAFEVSTEDRLLSVLPLSHMFEFTGGMAGPLHKGATIVYSHLKGPSHLKELLKFESISVLLATPIVFQTLNDEIEAQLEKLPRSTQIKIALTRKLVAQHQPLGPILLKELHKELGGKIKFWLAGGAHTPPELVQSLSSLGIKLLTGYGLTETSPIVAANTRIDNKPDSVGRPITGVAVRIDSQDGSETGEILVKGPNVMQGYWNNPEESSKVIAEDGWLRTGDSGFLDSEGHLHITGRIKSVIVTAGGYNVYPQELEEALDSSQFIKECCVFGRAGAHGEEVCAVILPAETVAHSADREEQMKLAIGNALSELADYKRISTYQLWDKSLPRTPSGKIRRGEVLRLFEQGLRKKKSKKGGEIAFQWDEDGEQACRVIAEVMDPAILRGIFPSGSHDFLPEMSLSGELGLDSFARLELASRLEHELSITIPENLIQEALTVEDIVTLFKYRKHAPQKAAESKEDIEEVTTTPSEEWRRWPVDFIEPSNWPLRDDPFVTTGRKILDIGLQTALRIYNSFETSGTDRLLLDPPYIVAANHSSHVDCFALLASFPQHLVPIVQPVAAADYFFSTEIRSALSTYVLNAVPFDRYGSFEESMKTCEQLLRKGHILIIFPEGTRSKDGNLGSFKPGIAHLSITVGCPIIPAYISGARDILPKGTILPKPEPLSVKFGVPLYPPLLEPNVKTCQDLTRQLRDTIIALSNPDPQEVQQVAIFPASSDDEQ